MSKNKAFNQYAFDDLLIYHYENNIPLKLIYDNGEEEVVNIIKFDRYNLFCKDIEGQSFIVFKHSLRKIETKADLDSVFEEISK